MDQEYESRATPEASEPNMDSAAPAPKSKMKLFLGAGCGCLTLVAIALVAVIWFALANKPTLDFAMQNITLATTSDQVKELLGEPISVGKPKSNIETDRIEFQFDLTGPNGSGTVSLIGKKQLDAEDNATWVKESMTLKMGDQVIDLNPEEELIPELDINFGE